VSRALEMIGMAIDEALDEIAAAEELHLLAEQEEQHWRLALNCFLRCVEVCGNRQHDARVRMGKEGRRDLW